MVKQSKDVPAKPSKALVEIVDNVKQFRRMCQSVIDLADAVHDVDTLERAAREADNRMAEKADQERTLNQQIQVTRSVLDGLQKDIAAAKEDAKNIVAKAKTDGLAIVAQAKEQARGVEIDAKAELANAKRDAGETREKAKKEAAAIVAAAQDTAKTVESEITVAREKKADLDAQCDEKAAELAGLQKQIDDLKAKASSILA